MKATPKDILLRTVEALVAEGEALRSTKWAQTRLGDFEIANPKTYVDLEGCYKWHAGCSNLVRLLGEFAEPWKQRLEKSGNELSTVQAKIGTLKGIKTAIEADLLVTAEGLIRADLFDDLLEQAEYLLDAGFFLAAGVLGRAVLEEHLRKWCQKAACQPSKSKPTINDVKDALYTAKHLDKLVMKHVESMTAVGNDAAHNLPSLKAEHVARLLRDVRDLLLRNPV